ncbi:MAG TPA: aromatic amino acid ammonia-lyase [Candidatus Bathyarchaeia archaeon]|nr:aromatic amino acid ammonia-lyase [Candidatus Bathyarchaeia archaeon]
MTVLLTGRDLDRDQVARVARQREPVELAPEARARMTRSREIVRAALRRGDPVYGSNTAVGVLKRVGIEAGETERYAAWMIRHHIVGQGPAASDDVVRATMLRLANHFAEGSTGVRPELADRLVTALNEGETPRIRTIGSVGQADLAPMAELADALVREMELEAGEGTALLDNNAFATGWAALAVADVATLLDAMDVAGALSLEGLAANPTMLHTAIADARPYPGLRRTIDRFRDLLEGSAIWDAGVARNLQDPLTFRNLPQIQGACRDVLDHVDRQLAIELNASQGNPIVVPTEERLISVANFEILPLAAALDYLRIILATALTSSAERTVKALGTPWSGLPTGLTPRSGTAEAGLTYLSLAAQSLAVEARLLAQPVSFELTSTAHAEGIEDRTTMAPLAARRVAEMAALGSSIVAIELAVAAQAVQLRGLRRGQGTSRALVAIRRVVPYLDSGDHVPDVTPLADAVRSGALGREALGGEMAGVDGA